MHWLQSMNGLLLMPGKRRNEAWNGYSQAQVAQTISYDCKFIYGSKTILQKAFIAHAKANKSIILINLINPLSIINNRYPEIGYDNTAQPSKH